MNDFNIQNKIIIKKFHLNLLKWPSLSSISPPPPQKFALSPLDFCTVSWWPFSPSFKMIHSTPPCSLLCSAVSSLWCVHQRPGSRRGYRALWDVRGPATSAHGPWVENTTFVLFAEMEVLKMDKLIHLTKVTAHPGQGFKKRTLLMRTGHMVTLLWVVLFRHLIPQFFLLRLSSLPRAYLPGCTMHLSHRGDMGDRIQGWQVIDESLNYRTCKTVTSYVPHK